MVCTGTKFSLRYRGIESNGFNSKTLAALTLASILNAAGFAETLEDKLQL